MKKINNFLLSLQRVSATSKIFLLQNLAVMVKAGLPLAEALTTLAEQTNSQKLKHILNNVCKTVREGKTFGESLSEHEKDFGELFVNMIKAGEASGQLEEVLHQLYIQTKKDHEIKTKIRNALTYPVIIVLAIIGVGIFMIIFVLPNITSLFSELDIELPIATRIMILASRTLQNHGLIILIIAIAILAISVKAIRTKGGRRIFSSLILKTPILSPIVKKINLARIARNLSSLIKTDIAIVETLNITSRIIANPLYKKALIETAEKVKKGGKMADSFKNHPHIFPPIIIQMVSVGEETGALDEVLENLASFYEEDVSQTMETLPTIIEPILMLFIGAVVAGVALAILMPMYSLTENF